MGAQLGLGLPYKKAHMHFHQENDQFYFQSTRENSKQTYQLDVHYERQQILYEPLPESLDFWLLERYSMYSILGNLIIRGDIHHDQWKVSMVDAQISSNTMLDFLQDETLYPTPQHMHYSRRKRFLFFPPKIVGRIQRSTDK